MPEGRGRSEKMPNITENASINFAIRIGDSTGGTWRLTRLPNQPVQHNQEMEGWGATV